MQNVNNFKGFDLFNDFEDKALQKRNRAVILTNILEDNFKAGKIGAAGALLTLGYMNCIPNEERKPLLEEFIEQAKQRGFVIG